MCLPPAWFKSLDENPEFSALPKALREKYVAVHMVRAQGGLMRLAQEDVDALNAAGMWVPTSDVLVERGLRVSKVGFDALLLDGQTGAYGLASPTFREVLCPPGTTMDLSEE